MWQELEKNNMGMGERHGDGLGLLGTILHWSNMNMLLEDTWKRCRVDIAGLKWVARLLEIGWPQWFVRVLVLKMVA
jgi:hypothetical protein